MLGRPWRTYCGHMPGFFFAPASFFFFLALSFTPIWSNLRAAQNPPFKSYGAQLYDMRTQHVTMCNMLNNNIKCDILNSLQTTFYEQEIMEKGGKKSDDPHWQPGLKG